MVDDAIKIVATSRSGIGSCPRARPINDLERAVGLRIDEPRMHAKADSDHIET
jgi:hypothetical protein